MPDQLRRFIDALVLGVPANGQSSHTKSLTLESTTVLPSLSSTALITTSPRDSGESSARLTGWLASNSYAISLRWCALVDFLAGGDGLALGVVGAVLRLAIRRILAEGIGRPELERCVLCSLAGGSHDGWVEPVCSKSVD